MDKIFSASDISFGILEQGLVRMVVCYLCCCSSVLGLVKSPAVPKAKVDKQLGIKGRYGGAGLVKQKGSSSA